MTREICIELSGHDEPIYARLLDDEEPEYSMKLWDEIEEPLKMFTWHTTSTGDYFCAKGRATRQPQISGTQAAPIGRPQLMCDVETGSIVYGGSRMLHFAYGPGVTEPLPTPGPVVAKVENADAYFRAGRHVWDSHYGTHQLVTVTVSRRGE